MPFTLRNIDSTTGERADAPEIGLDVQLLTPMLGGGFESGVPDTDEPFRVDSVRGHLRWWWRQVMYCAHVGLNSTRSPDWDGAKIVKEVRLLENEYWGSATNVDDSGTGDGVVQVSCSSESESQTSEVDQSNLGQVSYAYAQLAQGTRPFPQVLPTARATIALRGIGELAGKDGALAAHALKHAVSYWLRFGCIGARGRRGFGSLDVTRQTSNLPEPQDSWGQLVSGSVPPGFKGSLLRGARLFIGPRHNSSVTAWASALNVYRSYRKNEMPDAANRTDAKSRWPEADAWRELRGDEKKFHEDGVANCAPRADLGLPISFHALNNASLELDSVEAREGDRWPSPVITKALKDNGDYRPCILILNSMGPPVDRLYWSTDKAGTKGKLSTDAYDWPVRFCDQYGQFAQIPEEALDALASKAFAKYCAHTLPPVGWTEIR